MLAGLFGLRMRIGDSPPEDLDAYRERVAAFRAFVEGGHAPPLRDMPDADRRVLDAIVARARFVGAVLTRQNFVVLLPTVMRDAAHLYVVLAGRLAFEARVTADTDFVAAVRVVRERFDDYQGLPLERTDVEATTVLAGWLRDRKREGILLRLESAEDLERRLDELVVTLSDIRQRGPLPAIDGLATEPLDTSTPPRQ